jgi:NADH-quinone oxidoreductase subunit C
MLTDQVKETRVAKALEGAGLGGAIAGGKVDRGELTLDIDPKRIVDVCTFLKTKDRFVRLSALTCVDRYPMEPRFEVIYHLHSMPRPGVTTEDERLRLKCAIGGEAPAIDSVYGVWRAADWYEREVFDLFGVSFPGHPNLTRILMPNDWQGHPLRKDFPIHGHKYDYGRKDQ